MMIDPIGFSIYALPVGGGRLGLCPLPTDAMCQVADWSPDLVISVIEANEEPANLWHGFHRRHFPVVDFGIPTVDGWPAIETEALAILSDGGRVLVHCKGGCGRSGMVVLRLMLAAGEADALARLRQIRPCAIETEAQLSWAEGRVEPDLS